MQQLSAKKPTKTRIFPALSVDTALKLGYNNAA